MGAHCEQQREARKPLRVSLRAATLAALFMCCATIVFFAISLPENFLGSCSNVKWNEGNLTVVAGGAPATPATDMLNGSTNNPKEAGKPVASETQPSASYQEPLEKSKHRAAENAASDEGGNPPQTKPPYFEDIQTVTSFQPRFHGQLRERLPRPPTGEFLQTIKTNCNLIRSALMKKWLPHARKEPDGVYRTHIAFVGDGQGKQQHWNLRWDLAVCVKGKWLEWNATLLSEVPYSSACNKAVFEPVLSGNEWPAVPPGAQLTLTYHKIPYGKAVVKALGAAYAELYRDSNSSDYVPLLKNGFSNESIPVLRNGNPANFGKQVLGTWLSPSLRLRAPDFLFLSSGSWDVQFPEVVWHGFDLYSQDVYARPDFGTYFPKIVDTFDAVMRANYMTPLQALFKAWRSAWQQTRFQSGNLSALEFAYLPPRSVVVIIAPHINCDGSYYLPGSRAHFSHQHNKTHLDHRFFLRSSKRCLALMRPLEAVHRRMERDMVVSEAKSSSSSTLHLPSVNVIDWSLDHNPCAVHDSTHLDDLIPACRGHVSKTFYNTF